MPRKNATKPKKSAHGGARSGAGRKRVYTKTAKFSITLDAELLEQLDDRREQLQLTRSAATQQAIRKWLAD